VTRADCIVGRLAEAASGTTQDDWAQIRKELGWAYDAIDVAQKRRRQKLKSRRVFSLLAVFATVVIVQWQLDSYRGTQEISLRTFYVPVLTAAAAPFVLVLLVAFICFISSLAEVVDFLFLFRIRVSAPRQQRTGARNLSIAPGIRRSVATPVRGFVAARDLQGVEAWSSCAAVKVMGASRPFAIARFLRCVAQR
jgi:hypothetical protein